MPEPLESLWQAVALIVAICALLAFGVDLAEMYLREYLGLTPREPRSKGRR